jgi:hypothetical protein
LRRKRKMANGIGKTLIPMLAATAMSSEFMAGGGKHPGPTREERERRYREMKLAEKGNRKPPPTDGEKKKRKELKKKRGW